MGRQALSTWFPDRTPTWTDVCTAMVGVLWVPLNIGSFGTFDWQWVAVGFSVCVVALGPVANSAVGTRTERWGREIGLAGRALVIVLFALGAWVVKSTFDVPATTYSRFGGGIMLAIAVFVPLHVLYAGEVDGWLST